MDPWTAPTVLCLGATNKVRKSQQQLYLKQALLHIAEVLYDRLVVHDTNDDIDKDHETFSSQAPGNSFQILCGAVDIQSDERVSKKRNISDSITKQELLDVAKKCLKTIFRFWNYNTSTRRLPIDCMLHIHSEEKKGTTLQDLNFGKTL